MKQLIRTPLKTLITFLLLFLVMYAFSSRILEFKTTYDAINLAVENYRGVGWAEINKAQEGYPASPFYIATDPRMVLTKNFESIGSYISRYEPLTMAQINLIIDSKGVTSYDLRFMTSGVSDSFYRLDEAKEYYNYNARFIIEATLKETYLGNIDEGIIINNLALEDCILLAGNPEHLPNNETLKVYSLGEKLKSGELYARWSSQGRNIIVYDDSFTYDTAYFKNLEIGKRYVFVMRYEPNEDPTKNPSKIYIGDHLTNPWCEAIQEVNTPSPEYLKNKSYSNLQELIEITNSDRQTFDVVYTKDLLSIRRFNEMKMHIKQGRPLTPTDHLNKRNVCVVSQEFALANALKIGDSLSLKLGSELFETYKGLGALSVSRQRYAEAMIDVELVIVGIYEDIDEKSTQFNHPNWSYSINTIFVPFWMLPVDQRVQENHLFSPSEFSFIIENPENISSYLKYMNTESTSYHQEGIKLTLNDNGWVDIEKQFLQYRLVAGIALILIFIFLILISYFIVYSYIGRKKKEFAIMRALGTPKKKAVKSLLVPLLILTFTAFILSCFTALISTSKLFKTNQMINGIETMVVEEKFLHSFAIVVACFLFGFILLMLLSMFSLKKLSKQSTLRLLQVDAVNHKEKKVKRDDSPNGSIDLGFSLNVIKRKKSKQSILLYVRRHLFRISKKSILLILLTSILFATVGQFLVMVESNKLIYSDTVVQGKIFNGLTLESIKYLVDEGYVQDVYYEYSLSSGGINIVITNNISRYTGETPEIKYSKSYDLLKIQSLGKICLASEQLLEKYKLISGEPVNMVVFSRVKSIENLQLKIYKAGHRNDGPFPSDQDILELVEQKIKQQLENEAVYYRVAGEITTPSGQYDHTLFMPGDLEMYPIFKSEILLDYVELNLRDNFKIEAFKDYVNDQTNNSSRFIMDTSKLDQIKRTLDILKAIYPLFMILPILIGGFIGVMIMLNNTKEISILRILGTPVTSIVKIFAVEQFILCLSGLVLGTIGLLIYNGHMFEIIKHNLAQVFFIYLSFNILCVLLSTLLISKRNIFEQLQQKN